MSLLNNALREAEERQHHPEVNSAYTGAVQEDRSGQRWRLVLIFVLALALAAAGSYWFVMMNDSAVQQTGGSTLASVEDGQVERLESAPAPDPTPALAPAPEAEPAPKAAEEVAVNLEEPVAKKALPQNQVPQEQASQNQAPEKPVTEPVAPEPEAQKPEPEPAPQQTAAVKTTPQSPEAIDRKSARELEKLIAGGRMVEAQRRLASLTESQAAPRSRFIVARALVVDGDSNRALEWLPERVAANDPTLRMLRARAQHAGGQLEAAVATLEANVPAVADQPEYRVTLATLLQQQGQGQKAAAHWAELIAWDNTRAPWWVGLAIALEGQGEVGGATRAFEQAAALPGLSSSLADYVQRRLQSLRAG